MKIVFYRTLLTETDKLSPTERIIYSFLVSKSITNIESAFSVAGDRLNTDELYDCVSSSNRFELCEINNSKIARELHITRKTVIETIKSLKDKNCIKTNAEGVDCIYINKRLIEKGYFELYNLDKVKGELLIFYSYLKSKAERYGNIIDTFKTKLAEELNTTKIAITKLLNRLYKINLAKRLDDGKLLIM